MQAHRSCAPSIMEEDDDDIYAPEESVAPVKNEATEPVEESEAMEEDEEEEEEDSVRTVDSECPRIHLKSKNRISRS